MSEDGGDELIFGAECTFGGPMEAVVRGLGGRPSCPYCGGLVGQITQARLDAAMAKMAAARGETVESLREIFEWARLQPRCFRGATDLGRAFAAHVRQAAKAAKRAGHVQ